MRKSISLILAIVMIAMVFATIPFTAFAAEETTTSPDDVVIKVYTVEGETKTLILDIKRSEVGNYGEKNMIGAAETAEGKNVVVDILMPFEAQGQIAFRAQKAGTTITINGNNHLITTMQNDGGRNWGFFGNDADYANSGKIIVNNLNFKNLDQSSSIGQIYRGATVDFVDCILDGSQKHQGFWLTNQSNLNVLGTTVISAGGHPIRCSGGAVENVFVDTNASLVAEGEAAALLVNGNAAHTIDIKGTITGATAIEASVETAVINVNGGTIFGNVKATAGKLNLNEGTLVGKLEAAEGVATTAEGFKVVEKAAASIGNAVYATIEEAYAAAAAATADVTIKVLSDVAMTKQINPKHAFNVTIEGVPNAEGVNPTITIASDAVKTNKFRFEGGADYALKNLTIVNENAQGCLIQLNHATNGGDLVIENCDITSADQYCMINCLATSGVDQTIIIKDSKLTHTAAQANNAIITSGNAGSQKMNMIVNIENSTLTATQKAIWVNKASTGQITLKGVKFVGGDNAIIDLANPEELVGNSATVGKTTLNADGLTTFEVKEGQKAVNYDATNANISVNIESELPATVIAQVIGADGAVKATLTDIAALADFFGKAGDGDTIKLYQDMVVDNNGGYNVRGSVTIDGNGKTITYNGTGGDADMFWFKNTETEYDPSSVTEIPEGKMDTITIKNLKFVSAAGGAFRYYNTNLVLGEGNEIDLSASGRQMAWPASRQLGGITVTGGKYIGGGGYMFGVSNDNQTLTIEGGEFVSMKKGIIAIDGGNHTISGGTFTVPAEVEGAKLISINTAGGKATSNLTITGGKFNVANPLSFVLALRNSAVTVTVDGAEVDMYGNISFENNGNVLNLTAGKLDGSLAPKDGVAATINKAEGFNHVNTAALPEVYYQEGAGTAEGLDFVTALDRAAASFDDVTITLNKNVTLPKAVVLPGSQITVTIKGNGNTLTLGTGIGNAFQMTGAGMTLALESLTLTGDCGNNNTVSACVFQIKGADATLNLTGVKMIDLAAKWYIINIMGNEGATRTVNIDNCTATNVPTTFISSGNANGSVGGDHSNYCVINIEGCNLENNARILQINAGSTANIKVADSTLNIKAAPGDVSAIRLYEIKNLHGADVMPQTTKVLVKNSTITVPEQGTPIKVDANNAGITVVEEGPDNIVAEVFVDGVADPIKIRRDEFAKFFSTDMSTNITDDEPLKGNSWTLKIYMDLEFNNDTQLQINLNEGKEIIIDGDPNGTGVNAKITSNQGGNPLFRLRDNTSGGKITFKNLDRWTSSTMMQIYTNMAEINFDNCVWETNTRGITVYGGTDTTVNFKAGTVFTSTAGAIFFTDWGWSGGMITVEEGAKLVAPKILSMDGSANYTKMKLKVDGGEVVGDITVDDGIYMLLAGKWDGNIVVPADEEGFQIFLGTSVLGDEFVVTGTNDFVEEEEEETTTNQGGETTTVPGGDVTTVPGGDVTTVPGGDVTTVPGGDVTTVPGGDVTTVPGGDVTTVPGGDTTTAPAGDKPAEGCAGCGGFSIAATFLALICAAGAALVIKKK